jgi:tetratricopeptide (TPR) repeat protein
MRMLPGFSWIAIFVLGLTVSCSTVAFSASGGDAPAPSTSKPSVSPKKLKCKKGEVVRRVTVKGVKKQKCVKATAGLLPDTDMFEQGNALALDGEYEWALDVLELVGNQQDPDVLNMQGYSHRKAGRLDVAITFYRKALALRPDFVRAREYLGEGYVAAGRTDLAQLELAEIKLRCGTSCHEYQALAKAIATGSN